VGFELTKNRAAAEALDSSAASPIDAARVFQEHARFAWRLLRRLGVAEADVEDVCQEVFITVHRRLATFEGRSSVRTWLYGICVRVASDHRKRRVRRDAGQAVLQELAVDARQDDELALRQARAMLDRILDELDGDKRAVFVLYEIEELPMAEVAHALGCPIQTAYSRLHAARRIVAAAVEHVRAAQGEP
jgi:RNA polymerase sigma-70 factor (ECF subfamily)